MQRGRGRARGTHGKAAEKGKLPRPGSRRSSTSTASSVKVELAQFHDSIPVAARIPSEHDMVWANEKPQGKSRQVLGNRIMIRQQPAGPPQYPEILVLRDQMLKRFQSPDKYIKCISMSGYALKDFTNDIRDSMLDVNFPYIVVFLGSMQLGLYELKKVQKDITDFVAVITEISPNTMIVFSGLVPRPMDFERSAPRCRTYTKAYVDTAQQLRNHKGWNVTALSVFDQFLDEEKGVANTSVNYEDNVYLTVTGIRILRAAWLRFLGYFPKKAPKKSVSGSDQ